MAISEVVRSRVIAFKSKDLIFTYFLGCGNQEGFRDGSSSY